MFIKAAEGKEEAGLQLPHPLVFTSHMLGCQECTKAPKEEWTDLKSSQEKWLLLPSQIKEVL